MDFLLLPCMTPHEESLCWKSTIGVQYGSFSIIKMSFWTTLYISLCRCRYYKNHSRSAWILTRTKYSQKLANGSTRGCMRHWQ
jgi:hypothetical protein